MRHNLDVMHIEKNVCESVLDTILDVKGKSKIGAASRRDLELQELMEDVPVEAREDMLDSSDITLLLICKSPMFFNYNCDWYRLYNDNVLYFKVLNLTDDILFLWMQNYANREEKN